MNSCGLVRRSVLVVVALAGFAAASPLLSIASNFNGTAIAAGDVVWFSSVIKLNGSVPASAFDIYVSNSSISFTANSTNYNLDTPGAVLTIDPPPATPTTTFSSGTWDTTGVSNQSGNTFLTAFAYTVPTGGLPGGIKNVTWSADFATDATSSISFNWQWAAAVYSGCTDMTGSNLDYNGLDVLAADGSGLHAGVPTACESDVIGGARGGGGSNYTGSMSSTLAVTPSPVPEPSTWALFGTGLLMVAFFAFRRRSIPSSVSR